MQYTLIDITIYNMSWWCTLCLVLNIAYWTLPFTLPIKHSCICNYHSLISKNTTIGINIIVAYHQPIHFRKQSSRNYGRSFFRMNLHWTIPWNCCCYPRSCYEISLTCLAWNKWYQHRLDPCLREFLPW